ncbi:MAG: gamma-glutamylcyclotransferase [Opitutaceae bacterium]
MYGTLKRGCCNHAHLAGQQFIGDARTGSGHRLHDMGGYPGLVAAAGEPGSVEGEVWSVDSIALARLDAFEGVAEGLYRRAPIALQPPFADRPIEAYWPVGPVENFRVVGPVWRELIQGTRGEGRTDRTTKRPEDQRDG